MYLFFWLVFLLTETVMCDYFLESLSCGNLGQTKAVCLKGYTPENLSFPWRPPRVLCKKVVYSNVEWKCFRGKPDDEDKCATVEEVSGEFYCLEGDVLFGRKCYNNNSTHYRVSKAKRIRKKRCILQSCPELFFGTNYTQESYPAFFRCKNEEAEVNLNLASCALTRYWDKKPVCAGSLVFVNRSEILQSDILMCASSIYVKPEWICANL